MRLTHRQIWALFLVPILVFSAVAIADTAFLTNDVAVQNQIGLGYNQSGTPVVVLTVVGDYDIELSGDWADNNGIIAITQEGNLTVTTDGSNSNATVQLSEINGTTTNLTDIDSPNPITFDPGDKNESKVWGDIDTLNFTADMEPDDGNFDFVYEGGSSGRNNGSIAVRGNFSDGTQYGMVDVDSNEGLAVGVANSTGVVNFTSVDELDTHTVEIEELGTLDIRAETAPHDLLTDCTANVRFFEDVDDDPTIAERTTTSGQVDLTGLPVDQEFVVSAKCTDFNNRTVILDDLSQQQTVFLLNTSRNEDRIEFQVDDRTGLFGRDAELIVQKAINRSEYGGDPAGFSWTNVGGDDLGADSSYVIHLERGDRYRLKIQNDRGDERLLGTYVPQGNAIETLTVGRVEWASTEGNATVFNASIQNESTVGNDPPVIAIQFVNPANLTESPDKAVSNFNYSVFEAGNASNQIDSGSASGDLGSFYAETNITESQADEKWIIQVEYDADGETVLERRVVGGASVDIQADQDWLGLFTLIGITTIGLLYGRRTVNIGIVMMWLAAGVAMVFKLIVINEAWYIVSGFIVAAAVIRGELR